jgi:hypothetical protein
MALKPKIDACPLSWDDLQGNERVRHCSVCNQDVTNVSAMTEAEAAEFLATQTSCVRFARDEAGEVVTQPSARGWRWVGAGLGLLAGGALTASSELESEPLKRHQQLEQVPVVGGWLAGTFAPLAPCEEPSRAPFKKARESMGRNITDFASKSTAQGS